MLSSTLAERFPAMCGSETFATLVSSTSMNVASITVKAMTQGFECSALSRGRLVRPTWEIASSVVAGLLRQNSLRFDENK